jgi:hypothetical protein
MNKYTVVAFKRRFTSKGMQITPWYMYLNGCSSPNFAQDKARIMAGDEDLWITAVLEGHVRGWLGDEGVAMHDE